MRKALLAIPICLLITLGCSQDTREKLKHFFFEVPDETAEAQKEEKTPDEPRFHESWRLPEGKYASIHDPYANRKCGACHEIGAQMQPREDMAAACKTCHPRYFTSEVTHMPVAGGDCAMCHEYHKSVHPGLLTNPAADLCAECHFIEDLDPDIHTEEAIKNCSQCHNAHFGDEYLLKPSYLEADQEPEVEEED